MGKKTLSKKKKIFRKTCKKGGGGGELPIQSSSSRPWSGKKWRKSTQRNLPTQFTVMI